MAPGQLRKPSPDAAPPPPPRRTQIPPPANDNRSRRVWLLLATAFGVAMLGYLLLRGIG